MITWYSSTLRPAPYAPRSGALWEWASVLQWDSKGVRAPVDRSSFFGIHCSGNWKWARFSSRRRHSLEPTSEFQARSTRFCGRNIVTTTLPTLVLIKGVLWNALEMYEGGIAPSAYRALIDCSTSSNNRQQGKWSARFDLKCRPSSLKLLEEWKSSNTEYGKIEKSAIVGGTEVGFQRRRVGEDSYV